MAADSLVPWAALINVKTYSFFIHFPFEIIHIYVQYRNRECITEIKQDNFS